MPTVTAQGKQPASWVLHKSSSRAAYFKLRPPLSCHHIQTQLPSLQAQTGCVFGLLQLIPQVDWDYFGFQFERAFSKWPVMVAAGGTSDDELF